MVRIRQRIELLEEALLSVDLGSPLILTIVGVDQDRKVVSTMEFTVPQYPPVRLKRPMRRWRPRGY